jgi:A/G-specific adenine glycosylase
MLQQTQAERVVARYDQFLEAFPDFASLAEAPLRELLRLWQGLGYNRRAMALQRIAQKVVTEFSGRLPHTVETLRSLPGIGPATAGAIAAFAFNQPAAFVETNIRRVFLHFFFVGRNGVNDREILPLVEVTLDRARPRRWYYALMDYGVMIGKHRDNPNRRSAHYHRQGAFKGSDREVRGLILKILLEETPGVSEAALIRAVGRPPAQVVRNCLQLEQEGFVARRGSRLAIAAGAPPRKTQAVGRR